MLTRILCNLVFVKSIDSIDSSHTVGFELAVEFSTFFLLFTFLAEENQTKDGSLYCYGVCVEKWLIHLR